MEEFRALVDVIEHLMGPNGCPWDKVQTLQSIRPCLLEETYEVIEAIDLDDSALLEEELGDLMCQGVFLCLLAAKEKGFGLKQVLNHIKTKLIRRHPHIFADGPSLETPEEVLAQWNQIKAIEKKETRPSALDGIPKDLPTLARAQKVFKKMKGKAFVSQKDPASFSSEEQAGDLLWKDIQKFAEQGIHAEQALRKRLTQIEAEFREWEANRPSEA